MTRVDEQVEVWTGTQPRPDKSVDASHFGVRWTGTDEIQAPVAVETTRFSFTLRALLSPCGDAESVRLFFDDKPLSRSARRR